MRRLTGELEDFANAHEALHPVAEFLADVAIGLDSAQFREAPADAFGGCPAFTCQCCPGGVIGERGFVDGGELLFAPGASDDGSGEADRSFRRGQ
jgi:hypothetical protein